MFTADEFQLIRSHCLPDLEKFLKQISVSIPNWNSGDEFKIYDKLGGEITSKMCRLLKSNSIVEGYTKLLKLGKIGYDFSETDNELLNKVVTNKNKILQGVENFSVSEPIERPAPPPPSSVQKTISQPTTKTVTKTEHAILMPPIILGAVLIVVALICLLAFDSGIICGILALAGIISAGLGLRGEDKKITVTVPVESAKIQNSAPPPVAKPVAPVRQEKKAPFTQSELKEIFNVLTTVNKIFHAI